MRSNATSTSSEIFSTFRERFFNTREKCPEYFKSRFYSRSQLDIRRHFHFPPWFSNVTIGQDQAIRTDQEAGTCVFIDPPLPPAHHHERLAGLFVKKVKGTLDQTYPTTIGLNYILSDRPLYLKCSYYFYRLR